MNLEIYYNYFLQQKYTFADFSIDYGVKHGWNIQTKKDLHRTITQRLGEIKRELRDFFVFFFDSCFLKFKNALRNEKTTKLVFIFKYMRSSSGIKNYITYVNLSIQIYSLKNKFFYS